MDNFYCLWQGASEDKNFDAKLTCLKFQLSTHLGIDWAKLEAWQLEQFGSLEVRSPKHLMPSQPDSQLGKEAIEKGQVACLILAGGTGSRLGFDGPKGIYPLDEHGTTLFKIHFSQIAALNPSLPVAVMSSALNDAQTRHYLESHDYFGMRSEAVSFVIQENLPYFNEEGFFFLESAGKLAQGPNGNGYALHELVKNGILEQWKAIGVQVVHLVLVDNALANPFDSALIGAHLKAKNQVTLKVIPRIDPEEKVGVLALVNHQIGVVEYSELGEEAKQIDNFPYANISTFAFDVQCIETIARHPLPLHRAYKKMKSTQGEMMGWKMEAFIFDVLKHSAQTGFIVETREQAFAPLKKAGDEKHLSR